MLNIIQKISDFYDKTLWIWVRSYGKIISRSKRGSGYIILCKVAWISSWEDNLRNKYVNAEKLSSGNIYVLLYSIKNDDEGKTENLMNDSGTEFLVENETVVSISRIEGNLGKRSSVSVTEASFPVLVMQS